MDATVNMIYGDKLPFILPWSSGSFLYKSYEVNFVYITGFYVIFYHDVDEIFWLQQIRSLKLGHVTGPGWDGCLTRKKNVFHKKYKNLDDIVVYLIASLKSKWKNNKYE